MRSPLLRGALLAVAMPFALLFTLSGVAGADPDTMLVLTLVDQNGNTKSAVLTCDPPGGTHGNARHACGDVQAAQGDFTALPGTQDGTMCTMEYQPVTAMAEGTWRGEPVRWAHEYGNNCALHTATGRVFLF